MLNYYCLTVFKIFVKMDSKANFRNACNNGNLEEAKNLYYNNHIVNDYAQVCKNIIFTDTCRHGQLHIAKWLLEIMPNIDVSANSEEAFRMACNRGHIQIAQWLLELNPSTNIFICDDFAFSCACANGHLNVAQWLWSLNQYINVSAGNEFAFRIACQNGHLHVAKWLLSIKPSINISQYNECAFRHACDYGHSSVAKWLSTVNPFKYSVVDYDPKIIWNKWKIHDNNKYDTLCLLFGIIYKGYDVSVLY